MTGHDDDNGAEWWPLERVLREYRPGSFPEPWSWQDEHDDLFSADPDKGSYTWALADKLSLEPQHDPIELGNDGRVWDGHHRIVVAMRLGIEKVLVNPPRTGASGRCPECGYLDGKHHTGCSLSGALAEGEADCG